MKLEPRRNGKGEPVGATIEIGLKDLGALAVILGYAENADLDYESTQAKTMFRRLAGMVDALGAADSVSVYASSEVHRESAAYRSTYKTFGGEAALEDV